MHMYPWSLFIKIKVTSGGEFTHLSQVHSFSLSLSEVRVEGEDFRGNSFQAKSGGRCFL